MTIWPLPGVTGTRLQQILTEVQNDLCAASSQTAGAVDRIEAYLRWASDAANNLRFVLHDDDLTRLVLTPRYWATLANSVPSGTVVSAVNAEFRAHERDFETALAGVKEQIDFWGPGQFSRIPTYVMPDTNVLLQHEVMYPDIDWHGLLTGHVWPDADIRLVLPLLVIDELDDAKRGNSRSRARQTLKMIYEQVGRNVHTRYPLKQRSEETGEIVLQVLLDSPRHVRLPRPDDELVDRAVGLQSFLGLGVHFVTYDTGAALRAKAADLNALRLEHTG